MELHRLNPYSCAKDWLQEEQKLILMFKENRVGITFKPGECIGPEILLVETAQH